MTVHTDVECRGGGQAQMDAVWIGEGVKNPVFLDVINRWPRRQYTSQLITQASGKMSKCPLFYWTFFLVSKHGKHGHHYFITVFSAE